ncbi:CRISPR-associated endonuclease Cas2 [Candidatus Pacearchaeota archaeon]|nr:MAG: CRISPR-associated endonuclease Cas2 [Candidatus Pacearchaeota archaeon]
MYVIIVYDVSVERVSKVCQFLRQFLNWIQNSVFEGELTESELEKIKTGLKKIIDSERDSVIIYLLRTDQILKRELLGVEKVDLGNVI